MSEDKTTSVKALEEAIKAELEITTENSPTALKTDSLEDQTVVLQPNKIKKIII